MSDEIEERLGLPLVESIRENTGDTCFAGLYEEFVGGLQPCRSIITAKYEFFMLQDEKISAVAAARLLGCVLNLDDVLTRALIGSLFNIMKLPVLGEDSKERNISVEFDNFTLDKLWVYLEDPEFRKDFFHYCWHGPSFEDQDVMLSQIRHFVAAPSMLEYQSFSEGRAKPVIDIEFNYLQDYSAERFRVVVMNDDWSAVLCSPLEVHVIPAFLGFIRRNDYALNLADL